MALNSCTMCAASLETRCLRICDAVSSAFYNVLAHSVRRLCEDVQGAACMYGYIVPDCAAAPDGKRRGGNSLPSIERSNEAPEPIRIISETPPNRILNSTKHLLATGLRLSRSSFIVGAYYTTIASASAVGVTILFPGGRSALLLLAALAILAFCVTAICFIALVKLDLLVHRSSKTIHRLLDDMHLQHRLAGETARYEFRSSCCLADLHVLVGT